jgi:hypothetical protein
MASSVFKYLRVRQNGRLYEITGTTRSKVFIKPVRNGRGPPKGVPKSALRSSISRTYDFTVRE